MSGSEVFAPLIDIAVPTYNCARWIDEFMESLVIQDYTNWRIITRDDGSKDDTVALVAAWKERLGARMEIIENLEETNLGAVGNYDRLLQNCNASLVMMGDPDDVWKPGKITLVLNAMLEAERTYGSELPIIICTDAEMVDANLKPISPSFWKWTQVRSEFLSVVPRMLMENPALGATMIINELFSLMHYRCLVLLHAKIGGLPLLLVRLVK